MTQNADQTQFNQAGTLAPGYGAVCSAKAVSGHYSTDFTNVIKIKVEGGKEFTIEQPAHFDSVGYTQAIVDCQVLPIAELPNGGVGAMRVDQKRSLKFQA
jgi:hypothetical protein